MRKALGLKEGDRIVLRVRTDGTLELLPARQVAHGARGMFAHLRQGQSLVDELLSERRDEARREEE